jgi:leishmanolysin
MWEQRTYKGTGDCRNSEEIDESFTNEDYGEAIGVDSRCFTGTYSLQNNLTKEHPGCHTTKCEGDIVHFWVDGQEHICDPGMDKVQFMGGNGYINCPDHNIICHPAPCINNCHGNGDCEQGVCKCDQGKYFDDCSKTCNDSCVE